MILLGLAGFWFLSLPHPLGPEAVPAYSGDPAKGQVLYNIGGCISCHKPGPDQANADASLPSGGAPLKTPIGTLFPPNLTPDPETGLGKWDALAFMNAMQRGLDPDGRHLIPAFPYTSYVAMKPEDILDIFAYLKSLKPVKVENKPVGVPLAFVTRRGIGVWKHLGFSTASWQPDPAQSESWNRGSYLVNGPGHCGECHTPRTFYMARDDSRKFAGGPHPEGEGRVPALTGLIERNRYKDADDLASALQFGEMMGYDRLSSGGMGAVQANIAKLPESDIKAIAEYLVSLK
ncbi:MAG: cytochrome c [Parvibaculaceae bacterium]